MTKPKFLTAKFTESAIRFLIYFLAVALTPFLAKPIAPLFDWVGYSLMRPLFVEVFTIIFWVIEMGLLFGIEVYLKKKKSFSETEEEGQVCVETTVSEIVVGTEEEKKKKKKCEKRPPTPPMPLKNLGVLTVISIVCVFLISAIIGFKVKPFYDIGEKVTGYDLWCAVGVIGRNIVKCVWILSMIKACKIMGDEAVAALALDEKKKAWLRWVIAGGVLLLFGIFDVFTSVVSYPMDGTQILIGLAYILFYAAFTAVYCFTEENDIKAYFLIVFIYLF